MAVDWTRPVNPDVYWDGDPDTVPEFKEDTDWAAAVRSQFGLIDGLWRKIRAVGVILLRFLP
jgi:hypothetical protein